MDKVTLRWGRTGLAAALAGVGRGGEHQEQEEQQEEEQDDCEGGGRAGRGLLMEPRNTKDLEEVLAQYRGVAGRVSRQDQ